MVWFKKESKERKERAMSGRMGARGTLMQEEGTESRTEDAMKGDRAESRTRGATERSGGFGRWGARIGLALMAMVMGVIMIGQPVWAECTKDELDKGCVSTAILGGDGASQGCTCPTTDPNTGEVSGGGTVIKLIMDIVDILSVGVGILGVIGIVVVGLTYLSAGGNEEKTRTAKRRMLEIVIGLAAYALVYAVLKWLLPGFTI